MSKLQTIMIIVITSRWLPELFGGKARLIQTYACPAALGVASYSWTSVAAEVLGELNLVASEL